MFARIYFNVFANILRLLAHASANSFRHLAQPDERASGTVPIKGFRMDQMREQLGALDDARSGTGEIRIGIDGKHAVGAHRRNVRPAWLCGQASRQIFSIAEAETAWHDDENVRGP